MDNDNHHLELLLITSAQTVAGPLVNNDTWLARR